MLNIAICDDEKIQRGSLKNDLEVLLDLQGIKHSIKEYDSGEALLELADATIDMIFLDIEMKQYDGIETAKLLRKNGLKAMIIFITAYPDFVFQGYEVNAFHYILKPYKKEKLAEVLKSALDKLEKLEVQFLFIEQKSGIQKIMLHETLYFFSDKRKIVAVTKSNSIDFYDKLDNLGKNLPPFFVRIHQRYTVNLNHVTSVLGNEVTIYGEKLPISRNRLDSFMIEFARVMLN